MRQRRKRYFIYALALSLLLSFGHATTARASDRAFDAISKHLKSQYKAKKRRIPFMGLASLAVKIIRPAGVRSVKLAIFEELDHAPAAGSNELTAIMRGALSPEWQPIVRIRSREGEQMYIYATEEGASVKLMLLSIDGTDAFIARVKINPDKLKDFIENPKLLGISLK
ncbi:MAG: hypothetical protein ICV68_04415 [Pyrinomonadaceae bacterium]|nr:hypothetical protein [Pyrinomonadaceae bacterium]